MERMDFSVIAAYAPILGEGVYWTVVVSVGAALLSLVMGIAMAVVVLYGAPVLRAPVRVFMALLMGTPLLLQLFLVYFGLVQIGIDIPALATGILCLGLHYAVYNADVFRAGIVAVDPGQVEAARALGFGHLRTLWHFIVPQALRNTLPAVGSNMISLLKESALVSMISIAELVQATQRAISDTYRPFEFYIVAAALYYLLNLMLELLLNRLELKVKLSR